MIVAAFCLVSTDVSRAEPADLAALIEEPDFWTTSIAGKEAELTEAGFQWLSAGRDAMRSNRHGLTFKDRAVYEAIIRFKEEVPTEVILFFYNRGDAGSLSREDFERLIEETTGDLNALTGVALKERGRDADSAVKAQGRVWNTEKSDFTLEWSFVRAVAAKKLPYQAQFLRLTISPSGASAKTESTPGRINEPRHALTDHIEKRPDGAVVIQGIPMVDQGSKGYCVVASVERVLRYYGISADQHEMAQLASSDPDAGTNVLALVKSLKKISGRLGIYIQDIEEWNAVDMLRLVNDYNRATRRGKIAPEVKVDQRMVDFEECFAQFQPELFREVRLKKSADLRKFQRDVESSISKGIPLLWSVQVGFVPETGVLPQSRGGHMRLITGFNNTTGEVYYSDSWGLGHEEKHMSWEDAFIITTGLYSIKSVRK